MLRGSKVVKTKARNHRSFMRKSHISLGGLCNPTQQFQLSVDVLFPSIPLDGSPSRDLQITANMKCACVMLSLLQMIFYSCVIVTTLFFEK